MESIIEKMYVVYVSKGGKLSKLKYNKVMETFWGKPMVPVYSGNDIELSREEIVEIGQVVFGVNEFARLFESVDSITSIS